MGTGGEAPGPILLIEPDLNAVSPRFGLPAVASYPPLAQVRLAGQIDDPRVRVIDLRIPRAQERFERLLRSSHAFVGVSLTFTSNGDEAIRVASMARRASPRTVTVLGGTGASKDPEAFYDADLDFIAFRHGDASLLALVRELQRTGARTRPGRRSLALADPEDSGDALASQKPHAARYVSARAPGSAGWAISL